MNSLEQSARFYFFIDARSLGLYRIIISLLLISDWITRWPHLEAFYTSFGVLPVEAPLSVPNPDHYFSLLAGVRSLHLVQAFFLSGLISYLCLLAGFRTKIFHFLSLLFFVSVLNRNIMVRAGNDVVLVTMLLWSLFLPLQKRFSIDRLIGRAGDSSETGKNDSPFVGPSLAAFCIVLQIALIYFGTAFIKHGETWEDGTALYYALNLDQYVLAPGRWMAEQPLWVIKFLSWCSLGIEFAAAPMILCPWFQPYLRRILIVGLIGFHLGIAVLMSIWSFSFVMIGGLALLLLPEDWEYLEKRLAGRRFSARLQLAGTRLLTSLIRLGGRPNSLASEIMDRQSSDERSNTPVRAGAIQRGSMNLIVSFLLLGVLAETYSRNIAPRLEAPRIGMPKAIAGVISSLQLIHYWGMFAPDPIRDDGWVVIDGYTESGENVDPLTGKPPTFDKQGGLSRYRGRFWRKYFYRIWLKKNAEHRMYFGKYITRKNHRDAIVGERLNRFEIYYVLEKTLPPGSEKPFPAEKRRLWKHECFEK